MSFYVFFGYLKKGVHLTGSHVFYWAGLCMTSFIVMVSASRQFDTLECKNENGDTDLCKRTSLAISLGLISGLVGLVWAFLSHWMKETAKVTILIDSILAWFVFVIWIFGIIYVTFGGPKQAAQELGNLYFFTWASFTFSVIMAMNTVMKVLSGNDNTTADTNKNEEVHAEEAEAVVVKDDDEDAPKNETTEVDPKTAASESEVAAGVADDDADAEV